MLEIDPEVKDAFMDVLDEAGSQVVTALAG
jgi:hypothetical protein